MMTKLISFSLTLNTARQYIYFPKHEIDSVAVCPIKHARNLGLVMDSGAILRAHVNNVISAVIFSPQGIANSNDYLAMMQHGPWLMHVSHIN